MNGMIGLQKQYVPPEMVEAAKEAERYRQERDRLAEEARRKRVYEDELIRLQAQKDFAARSTS